ncbi:MAG: FHA domain-containing protein [Syntrophobacteraceae bacterium]
MKRPIILQELSSQKQYKINPPCVLGRGAKADLAFPDPAISQRHALILEIGGEPWIQDLESANGVYVNDRKIFEKTPLKAGDSIQLGRTGFILMESGEDISEQTIVLHSLESSIAGNLDHRKLRLIFEMTADLAENQDMVALEKKILPGFREIFKQDHGCIALFKEDGGLKPLFSDTPLESMLLSRSIVKRLFRDGESFLLEDALSEASLKEQESIVGLRIRSALCVPLTYRNRIYGLIYLDRNIPGAYSQDDLEFLRTIASILAPLIENARLLSELKERNADTMKTLRETQSRLIDMERAAAYLRLAQAMAHEIRNPLMTIGGLIRRMARPGSINADEAKVQAVVSSVERIESVLREVDEYVKLRAPERRLARIDQIIHEELAEHATDLQKKGIQPLICVNAVHLAIPVDPELFKNALSLIVREILPSVSRGSALKITMEDSANELTIYFGEIADDWCLCELASPELERKPWSLGLFLNLAGKIISDHGGRLLVDARGNSPLPLVVAMPRTIPDC